jgi:uncharacterized membrane protein
MRIKRIYSLYAINVLNLIIVLIISFLPSNVLRIILGVPVTLFFPGYTLLAALFPRSGKLNNIERFALNFGTSIAIVSFICLALNYTAWGIRLYPVLISLVVFSFIMSATAWFRMQKQLPEDIIFLHIELKFPSWLKKWSSQSTRDRIVTTVLIVAIIGAIGTLAYIINQPRNLVKYTEFYILGPDGKADTYTHDVKIGESAQVILGIVNHEGQDLNYKVTITIDGLKTGGIDGININDQAKWEQMVTLTPSQIWSKQKVEFTLYKGNATEPYHTLFIWINVFYDVQ